MQKTIRLYHTLKYLKAIQFTYRLYYILRNRTRKFFKYQYPTLRPNLSKKIIFIEQQSFDIYNIYKNNQFTFIGITHDFKTNDIDWNYSQYGKLWNYNLNYFDFLQQENITKQTGLLLIRNFINYPKSIQNKKMPFPISLRNINIIKFISKKNINDEIINSFIFNQYYILIDNIEYHLLGNHLLENGFSLLFGAYYFEDERLYAKAKKILVEELNEQILKDGAHFELTPMYHQIMLFRILDSINLIRNNQWKNQELLQIFTDKAELMLGWLETITYKNGDIPLLNDSAKGIAPTSKELFNYAKVLNIKVEKLPFSDCGYRKKEGKNYECVIDIGDIGPDYIPGHAHSDTFNFELYVQEQPVIVDTGISTYEKNETRTIERSTSSHNTVVINNTNQTDVWDVFRVARRAKIVHLEESNQHIKAIHDGYQYQGILHEREWKFKDKQIKITDIIKSKKVATSIGYLHLHPNVNVKIEDFSILTPLIRISFTDIEKLSISRYNYSNKFNYKKTSNVIIINFKQTMSMEINIL